jgi:hypothetical protein
MRPSAASPRQRATACSPVRVRERWVACELAPLARASGRQRLIISQSDKARAKEAHNCFRPLRGLVTPADSLPRARGLSLGYTLSPAARARDACRFVTQGSRTLPGLHSFARCAGSRCLQTGYPGRRCGILSSQLLQQSYLACMVEIVLNHSV